MPVRPQWSGYVLVSHSRCKVLALGLAFPVLNPALAFPLRIRLARIAARWCRTLL